MRDNTKWCRAALVAGALLSSVAFAQGSSVIQGTVTDAANGKAIGDAVVSVNSAAIGQEQTVVTDSAGYYRIPQLPPGVYTLTLQRDTYRPYTRSQITVRIDRQYRVNISLQPETMASEEITIAGLPPVIDIGSTNQGNVVSRDFIDRVAFVQPNANGVLNFASLASASPQVVGDQYGFSFSGSQSPENSYIVDGVTVRNGATGVNAGTTPLQFVEEANVITGGYQAEYGRSTGGVISAVTKSGSNELHGSFFANYTPGALSPPSLAIRSLERTNVAKTVPWNTIDFGADLGGPILKDRIWFYAGFAPAISRTQSRQWLQAYRIANGDFVTDNAGVPISDYIPGTRTQAFNDSRSYSYIAKLTFLLNADNNISLVANGDPNYQTTEKSLRPRGIAWNGGTGTDNITSSVALRYQGGFFDKRLLVDAQVSWFRNASATTFSDGSRPFLDADKIGTAAGTPLFRFSRSAPNLSILDIPAERNRLTPAQIASCTDDPNVGQSNSFSGRYLRRCPITGGGATYFFGGAGFINNTTLDTVQAKASATYLLQLLGHHIWKAGADFQRDWFDNEKGYSGGRALYQSTSGASFYDFRSYGEFTDPNTFDFVASVASLASSNTFAVYLQDSWSVMDVVTINAGVRWEMQQLINGEGGLGLAFYNEWSPRVGLIYDFTQQGRSKLYVNYSRYFESIPLDIADRSLTGESQPRRSYNPTTCQPTAAGGLANLANDCGPANAVRGYSPPNAYAGQVGNGKTAIDPAVQPQSLDEVVAGFEYEIFRDSRLGVSYNRRWYSQVLEDLSIDEGNSYFIGNPGSGLGSLFPKAQRTYDAATVLFNKSFSDGWLAQASYTWSYLRGNFSGLYFPEYGQQLDPNITAAFDLLSLLPNGWGKLSGNVTHQIRAYATKEFAISRVFSFLFGLTYTGNSGSPLSYLGAHASYGTGAAFILPRGTAGESPWVHNINAKVAFNFRVAREQTLSLTVDLFNIINFQAATAIDQNVTVSSALPVVGGTARTICLSGRNVPGCVAGSLPITNPDNAANLTASELNPNFKQPTAYQAPFSARFGISYKF